MPNATPDTKPQGVFQWVRRSLQGLCQAELGRTYEKVAFSRVLGQIVQLQNMQTIVDPYHQQTGRRR